ncbi:MAG: hypothetical protein LBQ95_03730 [Lachnospiraceae bacterium]|jgi:riboflavin kinase/FMN adenylyltransferase|nr:hypothetical protein [Lachnospiraceae bacterium]
MVNKGMTVSHEITADLVDRPTVITIGKFDGFHLGHQKLLKTVIKESKARNLASLVFVIDMGKQDSLMTREERENFLYNKVDYLLEVDFTSGFKNTSAVDFIKEILCEKLHAGLIVVGEDFRFGYKHKGDPELLRELSKECGYELIVVPQEYYKNEVISSTRIKKAIMQGDRKSAAAMLNRE